MTRTNESAEAPHKATTNLRQSVSGILSQAAAHTCETLHSAASAIRGAGKQSTELIESVTEAAGQRLTSAATSVENLSLGSVIGVSRRLFRQHPAACMVLAAMVAVGVGYIAKSQNSRSEG
jgi:hypothetical protein